MERLEVTVNTDPKAIKHGRDPTFRAYLHTPTDGGRVILSEARFVDGRNEVRPLGVYDPKRDVTSHIGSVTYSVEPIAANQLSRVGELVHNQNFDK